MFRGTTDCKIEQINYNCPFCSMDTGFNHQTNCYFSRNQTMPTIIINKKRRATVKTIGKLK